MAVFTAKASRPPGSLNQFVRKHPSAFGIPFVLLMVAASFGLTTFTQTRYDMHDQKVKNVSHLHLCYVNIAVFIHRYTRFQKSRS